mgnify:FL=1
MSVVKNMGSHDVSHSIIMVWEGGEKRIEKYVHCVFEYMVNGTYDTVRMAAQRKLYVRLCLFFNDCCLNGIEFQPLGTYRFVNLPFNFQVG